MADNMADKTHEHQDEGMREPPAAVESSQQEKLTFSACLLGTVASIGGFMFGYVRYEF